MLSLQELIHSDDGRPLAVGRYGVAPCQGRRRPRQRRRRSWRLRGGTGRRRRALGHQRAGVADQTRRPDRIHIGWRQRQQVELADLQRRCWWHRWHLWGNLGWHRRRRRVPDVRLGRRHCTRVSHGGRWPVVSLREGLAAWPSLDRDRTWPWLPLQLLQIIGAWWWRRLGSGVVHGAIVVFCQRRRVPQIRRGMGLCFEELRGMMQPVWTWWYGVVSTNWGREPVRVFGWGWPHLPKPVSLIKQIASKKWSWMCSELGLQLREHYFGLCLFCLFLLIMRYQSEFQNINICTSILLTWYKTGDRGVEAGEGASYIYIFFAWIIALWVVIDLGVNTHINHHIEK